MTTIEEKDEPLRSSSTVPFLRYELGRHAATLGLGLLLLTVLPLVRRAVAEDFDYWDGAWNVWGAAFALYVLMPLLVLAMSASGWARERSVHTLEWLYARPIPSSTLFVARAATIAVCALLWCGLAILVHGVGLTEMGQALSTIAGLPGPAALLGVQLLLALGSGLLASALAPTAEAAFRGALLVVAVAWTVAVLPGRLVGHAAVLVLGSKSGSTTFLDAVTGGFLFAVSLLLIATAWRLMRGVPEDPRRVRRAVALVAPIAGILLVGHVATLHLPLLAGNESPRAVWLGGESGLTFAAARGLGAFARGTEHRLYHPVLSDAGRRTVLRDVYAYRGPGEERPWANPRRPAAVLATTFSIRPDRLVTRRIPRLAMSDGHRWALIDAEGRSRGFELPAMGSSQSIGWSPSGDRFAWSWTRWPVANATESSATWKEQIVLLEDDLSMRTIEVPDALWMREAWIDDDTLLKAPVPGPERQQEGWWAIVRVAAAGEIVRHALPWGQALAAPVLHYWGVSAGRLPRLGDDPVVFLADSRSQGLWPQQQDRATDQQPAAPPRIARLIVEGDGRLELGPALLPNSLSISLGNLDDGSLVWAAPERRPHFPNWDGGEHTRIMRLRSFDAAPELLCTVPTGRLFSFLGQSGSWAVWDTGSIGRTEYTLWGCNVATGETREIEEWRPWAHPAASITERGLWSPSGWVPIGG